jgi:hypothetical protein
MLGLLFNATTRPSSQPRIPLDLQDSSSSRSRLAHLGIRIVRQFHLVHRGHLAHLPCEFLLPCDATRALCRRRLTRRLLHTSISSGLEGKPGYPGVLVGGWRDERELARYEQDEALTTRVHLKYNGEYDYPLLHEYGNHQYE